VPIDTNFPKNHKVVGKHKHAGDEHFHFVWLPRKEVNGGQLGIHGTMVAVDWDSCVAEGECLDVCPVQVFQWYRTENDVPPEEMFNATSAGTGSTLKDERVDYNDKSDPIREHDCIWCMACVKACHAKAIKVSEGNLVYHQQKATEQSLEKVE
jgi:NAD-dependent dihydropyrimidine dehydrogenase PreA subunit